MNQAHLKTGLTVTLLTLSLQVFAEPSSTQTHTEPNAASADLNYQNDYICNASVGNLITSGSLDFTSTNQYRFGFTYPVKVNAVWVKQPAQTNRHRYTLDPKPDFAAYKGLRFQLQQTTDGCQVGGLQPASRITTNKRR